MRGGFMSRFSLVVASLVILSTLAIVGCGGSTPEDSSPGAQVYARLDCSRCHGADREGTRTAPALRDLSIHWDRDGLVAYLESPQEVAASRPDMAYRNADYRVQMPSYSHLEEKDLRALADFLLQD
jgi:cytochrome c2